MTDRLIHRHDRSARIAAAGLQCRYGASWGAAVAVEKAVVGDSRPLGRTIPFGGGDRGEGRTNVSAGDGAGGRTR